VANLKQLFRLYKQYAKMDLLWLLRDTRYFLLEFFSDFIIGGCTIAGVYLLSINFHNFCGMTRDDILFMLGYSVLIEGLYMLFFVGNNTGMVSRIIGRGQLDHLIIQPVPLWLELFAQGFSPFSGSPLVIFGMILTWIGAARASITWTPLWMLLFLVYAMCSCFIILAFIYLLSCMAFYAPAAAEEISMRGQDMFSLKIFPLGNMKAGIKGVFLSVIPIGLTAWYPSVLLIQSGKHGISALSLKTALYLPAATVILITITIITFQKGMKHYAKYGSNRYTGFGHR
jgi:ABC-2 type transport system permease protein